MSDAGANVERGDPTFCRTLLAMYTARTPSFSMMGLAYVKDLEGFAQCTSITEKERG